MSNSTASPTIKNWDQCRARHAWERINSLVQKNASDRSKEQGAQYAREAHKLPVRIMASGLGQALAFLNAKANSRPGLKTLLDDLADWSFVERDLPGKDRTSLLKSVIFADSEFLRLATSEVLAYLQWLNRFAEAEKLTEDLTADG